jgi:hypothetical protein
MVIFLEERTISLCDETAVNPVYTSSSGISEDCRSPLSSPSEKVISV